MVRYNIVWNGDVCLRFEVVRSAAIAQTVHVTRRTVSSHRTIRTVRQGRVGRGAFGLAPTCQPCPVALGVRRVRGPRRGRAVLDR
jgi:hypothetical protein